jgi:UDP-3-O-[3-hydroxymyristoyl] N-acetylglucosamine deacetylase
VNQRTIAEKISCTGIGLHTGEPVQVTLYPARSNSGIVFARTDLAHPVEIPAQTRSVASTAYRTALGCGDATIATVEHLLAALYSLGIDNVRVEVDGPEIPVMDGSSASFVFPYRSGSLAPGQLLRRLHPSRHRSPDAQGVHPERKELRARDL